MGVSGILRPNGSFIVCDYGKHNTIVECVPPQEENELIFFSSNGNYGCIYSQDMDSMFSREMTKEQLKWAKENIENMDISQAMIMEGWIKLHKSQ